MLLIPIVHDWFVTTGTPLYLKAAFYGFLSSVSLPLGAALGLLAYPVDPKRCALIVAFGAGALIFAVSTELYAEALRQVEKDGTSFALKEIGVVMSFAVVGAVTFTLMNQKLEEWTKHPSTPTGEKVEHEHAKFDPHEADPLLHDASSPSGQKSFRLPVAEKAPSSQEHVALAMWLGVALDGIPEAVLLGFITNEKAMTVALIVSIFVANFPESFSSASMLKSKGFATWKIFALWGSLCVITTILAGLASAALPHDLHTHPHGDGGAHDYIVLLGAAIEGLAGGAMLAMVCATMLPEAFAHGGQWSGVCAVLGFLLSCTIKVYFGRASEDDVEAAQAVVTEEVLEEEVHKVVDPLADVVHKVAFLAYDRIRAPVVFRP